MDILEEVETQSFESICATDCESIYGAVVCADRQFSQTLVAQSGCDSIHTVHLEFMEMVEGQSIQSICATECESIYGANICADQQFSQTLVAQSGCDSIHTVHLEFMEIVEGQSILEVCPANCIALYGSTACSEERLVQTFTARSGCDSMHTFYFSMIAPITTVQEISICRGDSLSYFGQTIKEPGTYSNHFINQSGCDSIHQLEVSFNEEIQVTAITENACTNQATGQVSFQIEGGIDPYTIYWEGNLLDQEKVENLGVGTYNFEIIDAANCQIQQSITIEALPVPTINAEIEAISCNGADDGSIHLFSSENLTYSINGQNFTSEGSFFDLSPKNHEIIIKNEAGCEFMAAYELTEPPPLIVELPDTIFINLGNSVTLEPIVNGGGATLNYLWENAESLSCLDCQNPIAQPLKNTRYSVTTFNENNCESSDDVLLIVNSLKGIFVPNVFSPDGDGQNDNFVVLSAEGPIQEVETFKIFDRWGTLLYEANNFQPNEENFGWDGKYRGQMMDNGVYIYFAIIKFIDGTKTQVQGDVTLAR